MFFHFIQSCFTQTQKGGAHTKQLNFSPKVQITFSASNREDHKTYSKYEESKDVYVPPINM